jgi:hypothetical protein
MRLTRIPSCSLAQVLRARDLATSPRCLNQGQRSTAVARRLGAVRAVGLASLSTRGSSLVNCAGQIPNPWPLPCESAIQQFRSPGECLRNGHSPPRSLSPAVRAGCAWRLLPHDLPPWQTVYHYFRSWRGQGLWEQVHAALRVQERIRQGRRPTPSAAILDSQGVKTTDRGAARLRQRQEAQRPQAPPAGRRPRPGLQGPGDRRRRRRPRRRDGVAAAAGPTAGSRPYLQYTLRPYWL